MVMTIYSDSRSSSSWFFPTTAFHGRFRLKESGGLERGYQGGPLEPIKEKRHATSFNFTRKSPKKVVDEQSIGRSNLAMARALFEAGRSTEAFEQWGKALALQHAQLGYNHKFVAETLIQRGTAKARIGQIQECTTDLDGALQILHTLDSGKDRRLRVSIVNTNIKLAEIHHQYEQYDEATRYFVTALSLARLVYGRNSPQVGDILVCVGKTHQKKGSYTEAIYSYRKALSSYHHAGVSRRDTRVVRAQRFMSNRNMSAKQFWDNAQNSQI